MAATVSVPVGVSSACFRHSLSCSRVAVWNSASSVSVRFMVFCSLVVEPAQFMKNPYFWTISGSFCCISVHVGGWTVWWICIHPYPFWLRHSPIWLVKFVAAGISPLP